MKHQMWKAGLIMAALIVFAGSAALAAAGATAPAKEEPKAAAAAAAPAPAPAKPAAPAPAAHEELFWPDMWKVLHNPTPWLSMGLDHRFRIEAGARWTTLNRDVAADNQFMYQR